MGESVKGAMSAPSLPYSRNLEMGPEIRGASLSCKKFRTIIHSCGQCYLPSLDNTAEVLVAAESEQFK